MSALKNRLQSRFRELRVKIKALDGEEVLFREPTTRQAAELSDSLAAVEDQGALARTREGAEILVVCLHTVDGERVFESVEEVLDLPGSVLNEMIPYAAQVAGVKGVEEGKND